MWSRCTQHQVGHQQLQKLTPPPNTRAPTGAAASKPVLPTPASSTNTDRDKGSQWLTQPRLAPGRAVPFTGRASALSTGDGADGKAPRHALSPARLGGVKVEAHGQARGAALLGHQREGRLLEVHGVPDRGGLRQLLRRRRRLLLRVRRCAAGRPELRGLRACKTRPSAARLVRAAHACMLEMSLVISPGYGAQRMLMTTPSLGEPP